MVVVVDGAWVSEATIYLEDTRLGVAGRQRRGGLGVRSGLAGLGGLGGLLGLDVPVFARREEEMRRGL